MFMAFHKTLLFFICRAIRVQLVRTRLQGSRSECRRHTMMSEPFNPKRNWERIKWSVHRLALKCSQTVVCIDGSRSVPVSSLVWLSQNNKTVEHWRLINVVLLSFEERNYLYLHAFCILKQLLVALKGFYIH